MLPSHLLDPTKKKNEPLSHVRLGQAPPPPMPSLCMTGAMSQIGRMEASPGVSISYMIFRPRQLHDVRRPPLIVCHGGPSIPSNYLLPIVNGVVDRAVIFYDQFGCGKSSRPRDNKEPFRIELMVNHLDLLISKQWGLKHYHLLGHSFGGILAYEFLRRNTPSRAGCRSLILVSAPTSSQLIQEESKRLFRLVNDLSEEDEGEQEIDPSAKKVHAETFQQTHECRLSHTPLALMDAMAQAGPTPWRGIPAIPNYIAEGNLTAIPSMLVRGEYDFCTTACVVGWKQLIQDPPPECETLSNCSHYSMLEDEQQFGKVVSKFLQSLAVE